MHAPAVVPSLLAALLLASSAFAAEGATAEKLPAKSGATPSPAGAPASPRTPTMPTVREVSFKASDGNLVWGDLHDNGDKGRPVVLLFHQAAASRAEYAHIVPRLLARGYHVLAVDQRSGGNLFGGTNKTATAYRNKQHYLHALPDLEGALKYVKAEGYKGPLIVWGSSYSASLVILLAAAYPEVAGVLAFSPGEYLGPRDLVKKNAARLRTPVLVLATPKEEETVRPITDVIESKLIFEMPEGAVHGSSMLVEERCPAAPAIWPLVEGFLDEVIAISM